MKINYRWLSDYIKADFSVPDLANILTFAGIEVESITYLGKELENIIIAEILERRKHPNADKLSICTVFDGTQNWQVVCGAPNCDAHKKIAFAPLGTQINDILIKKVVLRGVESSGMICSEKELQLSEDHQGIMILPDNAPLGEKLADYLNRTDVCFELEITPNRPDLLGIIGIARDVAAATKQKVQFPQIKINESTDAIDRYLELENHNPLKCPRYTARLIRNVKISESPEWLKSHLIAIGLRPINNVVDVTNFVMMEYGHPLHAFDYDKLAGHKIIVRDANNNESFPALDEETYQLNEQDLVIADAEKPIALAGIIGGANSHITETTKHVVIEAANFLYSSVRNSSGKYKIFTDSSYRFERDIADETAAIVSKRAAQLIMEIAGGELCAGLLDSFPQPLSLRTVSLRLSRVKKLTTIDFSPSEVIEYLTALELEVLSQSDDEIIFSVPFFRKDLTREIDLVEEIIRLHGYNNVPERKERNSVMNKVRFYRRRKLQDIFVKYGFHEVVNWTFADPDDLKKLAIADSDARTQAVFIKNPLGYKYSILRTTLLPCLLKNLRHNIFHNEEDIALFENSKVFFKNDSKLALEKEQFAGVLCGKALPLHWREKPKEIDFFDVKGMVEECLLLLGIHNASYQPSTEPFYQSGVAADVYVEKKLIASLGKLDRKILETFEIKKSVFYLEIKFSEIEELNPDHCNVFKEISKFPAIKRDLSFLIPEAITVKTISDLILQINPDIIQSVVLFDEYKGKNVKEGWRSLSFSLLLSSYTKTLTDEYVNKLLDIVIEKLREKYQIEMR
jgi:phenylalanyl-tRNA synthetase beta chain